MEILEKLDCFGDLKFESNLSDRSDKQQVQAASESSNLDLQLGVVVSGFGLYPVMSSRKVTPGQVVRIAAFTDALRLGSDG